MKKTVYILLLCLTFFACNKESEQQIVEDKVFDFKGRRYEYYDYWITGQRSYFAMDFVAESNYLMYNGHDIMGSDNEWHRHDTLGQSFCYAYQVKEGVNNLRLWTYLSDNPYNIDDFYNTITRHIYEISADENQIFYKRVGDEVEKVYERVK